jgi:MYXO-CTERM domain-containing protein
MKHLIPIHCPACRVRQLFALALSAAVLLAEPARAATLTDVNAPCMQSCELTALQAVQNRAEALGAKTPELRVRRVELLSGGQVIRIEQVHGGLRVLGADVAVLVQENRIVSVNGVLQPLPTSGGARPDQRLSLHAVIATLRAALPDTTIRRGSLAYWPGAGFGGGPVWILDGASTRPFGLWQVLVDATSGNVLWRRPALQEAVGRVYATNPAQGTLIEAPLLGLLKADALVGENADVSSCTVSDTAIECARKAVPDSSGDYLFAPHDPDFSDPFSEVQAYYHVDTFHRFMAQTFGYARAGGQAIKVMVNLQVKDAGGNLSGYDNAFFGDFDGDGRGDLVFGQTQRDFAYDGDVVHHEFTHSVIDETSGLQPIIDRLGYNAMPSGLNEGFADLMSCAFSRDPVVGEYMQSGGLRTLSGPSSCPGGLSGESHADGLVWGRAVWAIRSKVADQSLFDLVVFKTMASLSKHASYADAATQLLQVAQLSDPTLGPLVSAEIKSRGLEGCSRIVPLPPDTMKQGLLLGRSEVVGLPAVPASLQYRIDVPSDALELQLSVSGAKHAGSSVGAYIRRGEAVSYQGTKVTYDVAKPGATATLTFTTADEQNALVPGTSYFVLPVNEKQGETTYRIEYSLTLAPPPPPPDAALPAADLRPPQTPDAGRSDQGQDVGPLASSTGCSCTTTSGSSAEGAWFPFFLLFAAAAVSRRRPRR